MMLYPAMNKLTSYIPNRYMLVNVVARRARQIAEAAEDHRASSGRPPRTIYGRIVAEADRVIDCETTLRRTVQYGLEHAPELDREGQFARFAEHLRTKYGEGGYLRLWLPESENASRLDELRAVIRDDRQLRVRFDELYDDELRREA